MSDRGSAVVIIANKNLFSRQVRNFINSYVLKNNLYLIVYLIKVLLYYKAMDKFTAIADSTRRHIIELLASHGELSATEICGHFQVSPQAISQHLKVLRESEVVSVEKRAQQRIYRLNPDAMTEVEEWAKQYRLMLSRRFEKLDRLLQTRMEKLGLDPNQSEGNDEG